MGEVYKARDNRLQRSVAIKILPSIFAADPERLARFEREAQVLASLNHPNIAHIYGVEETGGGLALVMELVDGPTLAEVIARRGAHRSGSWDVDPLAVARQLAEALEAAHDQGIIHRDLKPQNIILRPDGTVKILDFGLAKALDPVSGAERPDNSPTITNAATRVGTLLGTAAYMAPEQIKGRAADRRADIWAFGAVLYELWTGTMRFAGDLVSEILARVIERDPEWSQLPADTPPAVARLLRRARQGSQAAAAVDRRCTARSRRGDRRHSDACPPCTVTSFDALVGDGTGGRGVHGGGCCCRLVDTCRSGTGGCATDPRLDCAAAGALPRWQRPAGAGAVPRRPHAGVSRTRCDRVSASVCPRPGSEDGHARAGQRNGRGTVLFARRSLGCLRRGCLSPRGASTRVAQILARHGTDPDDQPSRRLLRGTVARRRNDCLRQPAACWPVECRQRRG